jgi:hypothetical protein
MESGRYSKEVAERNLARIWVDGLACRQLCAALGLDHHHFRARAVRFWEEEDAKWAQKWTGAA